MVEVGVMEIVVCEGAAVPGMNVTVSLSVIDAPFNVPVMVTAWALVLVTVAV